MQNAKLTIELLIHDRLLCHPYFDFLRVRQPYVNYINQNIMIRDKKIGHPSSSG